MTSLIEKYYRTPYNVTGFYVDRVARLFPQYMFYFLVASICIYFFDISSDFINHLTPGKWLLNIPILPLGLYMYWDDGALVIPQAWSLGLEMTFYLIMPWIVRYFSLRMITTLMALSIAVFLAAYAGRINSDWYGYRLLPGTLFIFITGALFHQKEGIYRICIKIIFLLSGALLLLAYQTTSLYQLPYNKEVLLGILIGIPVIGVLKNIQFSATDEFFGNLSYGVFLNHFIVLWMIDKFYVINDGNYRAMIIISISCFFAFISYVFVEIPALTWRRRLRSAAHAKPAIAR
jgi:peptidoglycan/LPS O-acetylase OafA/YrhL